MPAPAFRHGVVPCPGCEAQLAAPIQAAGRTATCKSCGARFTLPDAEELFESAVAYLLDHDQPGEHDEPLSGLVNQIQRDTMVHTESSADVAWLG